MSHSPHTCSSRRPVRRSLGEGGRPGARLSPVRRRGTQGLATKDTKEHERAGCTLTPEPEFDRAQSAPPFSCLFVSFVAPFLQMARAVARSAWIPAVAGMSGIGGGR